MSLFAVAAIVLVVNVVSIFVVAFVFAAVVMIVVVDVATGAAVTVVVVVVVVEKPTVTFRPDELIQRLAKKFLLSRDTCSNERHNEKCLFQIRKKIYGFDVLTFDNNFMSISSKTIDGGISLSHQTFSCVCRCSFLLFFLSLTLSHSLSVTLSFSKSQNVLIVSASQLFN